MSHHERSKRQVKTAFRPMRTQPESAQNNTSNPIKPGFYDEWSFNNAAAFREFYTGMFYTVDHPSEFPGVDPKKTLQFLFMLRDGSVRQEGKKLIIRTPARHTRPIPPVLRYNRLMTARRVCLVNVEGGKN